jgi:hypothetical protein
LGGRGIDVGLLLCIFARLFERMLEDGGKNIGGIMFMKSVKKELFFKGAVMEVFVGSQGKNLLEHEMEISKE